LENELRTDAECGQHVDERFDVEEVDSAPHQIAYARLRHAKKLGGLGLLQPACHDDFLHLRQEFCTDPQVVGFAR
jgi:hypothetical protein